ncbi:ABC transporter permease [Actinotalea ferrariae]|uniref:ABC transporter permease n=1 Tax=Actinotalea ferrariae TaxID=1386098 RepID=UPI001C8B3009|nr:ABC transporter permease [Actinotalea ferrariae]MBX9246365.1 ABC transporter permease [Actinotalea ferrariae]
MTALATVPTTAQDAPWRPRLGWAVTDTVTMVRRSLRRTLREPDALFLSVALPVILLLLFVYVFGGAIETGTQYVDYVVPGIVLLCAGFGAAGTAVTVAGDMTEGIVERLRTTPVHPAAVLTGHVVAGVARNLLATSLVVGLAHLVGFRAAAGPQEWLAVAGLLVLYILAFTWIAVCLGLVASSPEAASGYAMTLQFLPYLSSAFVPTETMPRVLQVIAENQPVTPVTDTVRAWLLGWPGADPWVALAWCVGLLVVARTVAVVLFRRHGRG